MPSTLSTVAALAGLAGLARSACTEISGNWYCNQVNAITYDNFGGSGTYNRVSYMSDSNGECNFTTYSYSGAIAPFDEELSLHIRGPIQLKQFAYYTPTTSSSKVKRDKHIHAHKFSNVHARHLPSPVEEEEDPATNVFEERAASTSAAGTTSSTVSCPSSNSTTVTASGQSFVIECGFDRAGNINMIYTANFMTCIDACVAYSGCVDVSYVSNGGGACYMKGSLQSPSYNSGIWGARLVSASSSTAKSSPSSTKTSTSSTSSAVKTSTATTLQTSTKATSVASTSTTTTSTSTSIATSVAPTATGSTWTQQSYYSSSAGTANNVVFLNNMGGGSVSGVWSSYFGSSLSYASSDGTAAASSPQTLQDMVIENEVILFSGKQCSGENGDCGYYRPGTVAYHGFGGAQKIFLLEFGMPSTGSTNEPAIWLLNALIPRTQQYGSCTCWGNTAGCGELDLFETLSNGSTYMTSSIHGVQAGGDSDYTLRPTSGTMKAAVVLNNDVLQITVLPSSFTFPTTMTAAQYASLMSPSSGTDSVVTLSS